MVNIHYSEQFMNGFLEIRLSFLTETSSPLTNINMLMVHTHGYPALKLCFPWMEVRVIQCTGTYCTGRTYCKGRNPLVICTKWISPPYNQPQFYTLISHIIDFKLVESLRMQYNVIFHSYILNEWVLHRKM